MKLKAIFNKTPRNRVDDISNVFFTHSFFKKSGRSLNNRIKNYLKIFILVLLTIFSLAVLYTLDEIFFNSKESVTKVLQNLTYKLKEYNFVSISRSSILVWGFLIASLTNFGNINSPELKFKKYLPWMLGYFAFSFVNAGLYFFLPIDDKMILFYLSFMIIAFVLYNFTYIWVQEKHEAKLSPVAKNKMMAFIISYSLKLLAYGIFYLLLYFFITGGQNELMFRQNVILDWINGFLSKLNEFKNIVILFLIVSGTILLWLFSNLNYLLYLKQTVKNPSKYEAIFYFGLIIGFTILIWFSQIAFGEFLNFDLIWDTSKAWMNLYILSAINLVLITIFGFLNFNKRKYNFGPLIHNLVYTSFNFLIWTLTIGLTLFNKNDNESFKMVWVSSITTIIIFGIHFFRSMNYLKGFNGIIVGTSALVVGVVLATIGYNNHLMVNGNVLNVNSNSLTLNELGYLFIFLIALVQLIFFLTPYLLISFDVQFKWIKKINLQKLKFWKKSKGVKHD